MLESLHDPPSEVVEQEQYLKILLQFAKYNLPLHLPEDVWGIMAPAVLYPGQMDEFYMSLSKDTPCTLKMMVCSRTSTRFTLHLRITSI